MHKKRVVFDWLGEGSGWILTWTACLFFFWEVGGRGFEGYALIWGNEWLVRDIKLLGFSKN